MIVENLLIKLGINADTKALDNIQSSIKKLPKIASIASAAIGVALGGLTAFVRSSTKDLDTLHQLSKTTGEAVESLYLLSKVAEVNGSSAEAARASISGLAKAIGGAVSGVNKGAIKAFEALGISTHHASGEVKSATEVFSELQSAMQGISEQEQIALTQRLGIDASLIQTLRLTSDQMHEISEEARLLTLGIGTAESAQTAAQFNDAFTQMLQILKGVREFIAINLAPAISSIANKFKAWFKTNNDLIKNGLKTMVKVIVGIIKGIGSFIKALDNVISSTIGWKAALYGLIAVLALVKAAVIQAMLTNPIGWIIAAVYGLILIVGDLITHIKGGISALGGLWNGIARVFRAIGRGLRAMWQACKQAMAYIVKLFLAGWEKIKSGFQWLVNNLTLENIKRHIQTALSFITGLFNDAFNWITQKWEQFTEIFSGSAIVQAVTATAQAIISAFKDAFDWVANKWQALKDTFSLGNIKKTVTNAATAVSDGISNAASTVAQKTNETINEAINWARSKGTDEKNHKPAQKRSIGGKQFLSGLANSTNLNTAKANTTHHMQNSHQSTVNNVDNKKIEIKNTINATLNNQTAEQVGAEVRKAAANSLSSVLN